MRPQAQSEISGRLLALSFENKTPVCQPEEINHPSKAFPFLKSANQNVEENYLFVKEIPTHVSMLKLQLNLLKNGFIKPPILVKTI